jgi:hypothetical protein
MAHSIWHYKWNDPAEALAVEAVDLINDPPYASKLASEPYHSVDALRPPAMKGETPTVVSPAAHRERKLVA